MEPSRGFNQALFSGVVTLLAPLSEAFSQRGYELYLVGGYVRDAIVASWARGQRGDADDFQMVDGADIDCTTPAHPDEIKAILQDLSDQTGRVRALWTQGERFGTIGARFRAGTGTDYAVEITTYRAEQYDPQSRKPTVVFGSVLREDLARRDFTINAMAVSLRDAALVDPFGGIEDLAQRRLRTPLDPEVSFRDDPLRMLRAARFLPRFDLTPDPALLDAAVELKDRLAIVSAERIHDELERLFAVKTPSQGWRFLASAQLIPHIIGFQPTSKQWDQVLARVDADLPARSRRWAFLLVFSADEARGILARLKYSNQDRTDAGSVRFVITRLAEAEDDLESIDAAFIRHLLHGVRRDQALLSDALALANHLASVPPSDADNPASDTVRSDRVPSDTVPSNTVPSRRTTELAWAVWEDLQATEDVDDLGPGLRGEDVIAVLDLQPGPAVGTAMAYLQQLRLNEGPLAREDLIDRLRRWYSRAAQ